MAQLHDAAPLDALCSRRRSGQEPEVDAECEARRQQHRQRELRRRPAKSNHAHHIAAGSLQKEGFNCSDVIRLQGVKIGPFQRWPAPSHPSYPDLTASESGCPTLRQ
eukprot:600277-Rhodomonas_salina.2